MLKLPTGDVHRRRNLITLIPTISTKNTLNCQLIHNIFLFLTITIVCTCFLKLWKLSYNAWNEQYKSLIALLATAYDWSHARCHLNTFMLLNDLFKILSPFLHLPRVLFPMRFPTYNSVAAYFFPIRAT